jgi:hydroxymethylbilane synthase
MKALKLGTRNSRLALWQANYVKSELESEGYEIEIVEIISQGEKDLISPLYELGVQGIFTKELDMALLNGSIDIAVHSLKDVPTVYAQGLFLAAVPHRGNHKDVLVYKKDNPFAIIRGDFTVATSSLRRKAQWLKRFPLHAVVPIRGNVNSRLKKLKEDSTMDAAIFAAAGLERLGIQLDDTVEIANILPAPSQGALGVFCRKDDAYSVDICQKLNDETSRIATSIERDFLYHLDGGCTMPIGAYAELKGDLWNIKGCILSEDGQQEVSVELEVENWETIGRLAAKQLLESGGKEIRNSLIKRD